MFVNAPAEEVCRTFEDLTLDLIQLHGDEPPDSLAALGGRPAMKAFGAEADRLFSITSYLSACRRLGCLPQLILLDAPQRHGFGGSGKLADWSLAKAYRSLVDAPPLVLAGGLKPENVGEAICATGARAVDTASGVEPQPGIKDAAAMAAFVAAARKAFVAR